MIAITSYFNPQRSETMLRNYLRFRGELHRQRVELIMVELCLDDDHPETETKHVVRGTRHMHLLWQKEALLNWALDLVPDSYTGGVAWLDCDTLFLCDDWARRCDRILGHSPVMQPFSEAYLLDRGGEVGHRCKSSAWLFGESDPSYDNYTKSHPGLAWAARIELLRKHRLYDRMVTGSGDTVMFRAFTRSAALRLASRASPEWRTHANEYCSRVSAEVNGKVGCALGGVIHLYHGPIDNRGYQLRWDALGYYDPELDVRSSGSLLEWTDHAPRELRQRTAEFLASSRAGVP